MSQRSAIPAVAIVGYSGAGKTTLIEQLLPVFNKMGLHIGVVKHDVHQFDIDHPGKDTYRHREAGAAAAVISSETRLALMVENGNVPALERLIELVGSFGIQAVLVEGYKQCQLPKLAVVRREKDLQLLAEISGVNVCAVGGSLDPREVERLAGIPCLPLSSLTDITSWILSEFDHSASTH